MKFGPCPTARAEGAILAHSLHQGGIRLRKGRVLTAQDIATLSGLGLREVVVARLGPDDLHEDVAATDIATALVPDPKEKALRLSVASTGRVNVVAVEPGIVRVEATRIDALNSIDPVLTVATLPPLMRVEPGDLVATVKVIAYGAGANAVAQAAKVGHDALGLHLPLPVSVGLIETRIGASLSDKGADALAARLKRLGVPYSGRKVVAHDIDEIAQSLRESRDDVICILTASATSDIHDTAPEAVRRAGGRVASYGMPVDPGNLLFTAKLDGRNVIGLPGCARSPALNGADWVLERVLCGVPVGPRDIAAMGVGGLLKEIPTRPRPRRAGPDDLDAE